MTDADGHTFKAGAFYGDLVQYYLKKLGSPIKTEDGQDGWFNAQYAKTALKKARSEIKDKVSWPIVIDVPYLRTNDNQIAQAEYFKKSIENVLDAENVIVNLVGGEASDYYASYNYAYRGSLKNYDLFYGTGWSADYGDPSSYLDTFAANGAGYMTRTIGLY